MKKLKHYIFEELNLIQTIKIIGLFTFYGFMLKYLIEGVELLRLIANQ
jgi:hypothetical protein